MHNTSVILVFSCAVAACGGGPATEPDASSQIDAAIDAAPQRPESLIGVWVKIPSQVQDPPPPPAERDRFRLNADGTFIYEEEGDDDVGTWTADTTTFTMMGSNAPGGPTMTLSCAYRLEATQLVVPAFLPVGTVDGSVGTWRTVTTKDAKVTTQTLELRADSTATMRIESDDPRLLQGTWAYDVDDVVFTTMIDTTTLNIHLQEIRGVALGSLFEREVAAMASLPRRMRRGAGEHVEYRDLQAWLHAR